MKRRRYTAEFKAEAARMLIMDGLSANEVAQQLGVEAKLLRRWKNEHLEQIEDSTAHGSSSPKQMAEEIAQLRKELAKSKRMNEILKKTVGFFSKED